MLLYIIVLLLVLRYYIEKPYGLSNDCNSNNKLKYHGYYIYNNFLSKTQVTNLKILWKHNQFNKIKLKILSKIYNDKIHQVLGKEYNIINYSHFLECSSIHTYHRDVTNSKEENKLTYPSYTMIIYLDDSSGLEVVPSSHINNRWFYLYNVNKIIYTNPGQAIIFNANLLHCGLLNYIPKKRYCIQLKIAHNKDIYKLGHLVGKHVLMNKNNNKWYPFKYIENTGSFKFPIISQIFSKQIKTSFDEKKNKFQSFLSRIIFSDPNYYKPVNV